jgi:uncharacterized protein YggU (UPF0235/DUF167 family)
MFIKARVKVGQKKEAVSELPDKEFRISVKEKAERNAANARIVKIVADKLGVPIKKVRIVSGHRTSSRMLQVAE